MQIENEVMMSVLLFATVLTPITTGLVELIKKTIDIKVNLLPLVSLVTGLIIGFAAEPFTDLDLVLRLWAGAFAGLSGTGLYELIFTKREGTSKENEERFY